MFVLAPTAHYVLGVACSSLDGELLDRSWTVYWELCGGVKVPISGHEQRLLYFFDVSEKTTNIVYNWAPLC